MKIFKINEYVSHINESTINMDFGDVYAPKSEVELVNFIHNTYHEFFNRKKEFGFDDIKQYKIDYSQIRDKSIVTKTLMQHEMLTLDDIEFLYVLGTTKDDIKNKIVSAYDADESDVDAEHLHAKIFIDTCINSEHVISFLGDIEWEYEYNWGYPESPDYCSCTFGTSYVSGDLTGVKYSFNENNTLIVDGDLLKKFPIYNSRESVESEFFPCVYSSENYESNDYSTNIWLKRHFKCEMESYIEDNEKSSYYD